MLIQIHGPVEAKVHVRDVESALPRERSVQSSELALLLVRTSGSYLSKGPVFAGRSEGSLAI